MSEEKQKYGFDFSVNTKSSVSEIEKLTDAVNALNEAIERANRNIRVMQELKGESIIKDRTFLNKTVV
jgi:hypothetical protein